MLNPCTDDSFDQTADRSIVISNRRDAALRASASDPVFSSPRRRLLQAAVATAGLAVAPLGFAQERGVLRVGFQKGGGLLGLLKAQGGLEKLLAGRGWTVSWHEFPAGPQLLEALNAGSVDVGYTGAPPPIFAQSADKDIVYIGAEPGGESVESIVVKPTSTLSGVADLKGKQVAVQKGSSANYLLVAALQKAGLNFSDIKPIYLAPADARAAFESDRVDAWSIWDPYLAAIQSSAKVRVLADYKGLLRPDSFYESSRKFAAQQPQILSLLLEELARVGTWAVANPREVAVSLSPALGLPVEVLETWQRRTRYGVRPIGAATIATQQKVADTFFDTGLIPKRVAIGDAVWVWPRG